MIGIFFASAAHANPPGGPHDIVVPNSLAELEGADNNGFPFWPLGANPPSMRYQQVFAAGEFASIRAGGEFITHIAFRPDGAVRPFSITVSSVQINLSTTLVAPDAMSAQFANNVGLDDAIVLPPTTLALASGPATSASPRPFSIIIPLARPFFYNPAVGNLLLDLRVIGGNSGISLDAQDRSGDGVGRQYSDITSGNLNSTTASTLRPSLGLVTRFTVNVPEPAGTWPLLVAAAYSACTRRRRRT